MTSTQQKGISTERVCNPTAVNFIDLECAICHDILWKPVACQSCETPFCSPCIQQWLKGTYAFDIQIWSADSNQWLDFDDDYLNQQNPYDKQEVVHLKVLRTSGKVFQEDRFL